MDNGRRARATRRAAEGPPTAPAAQTASDGAVVMQFGDLNDRQRRGVALWERAQSQNGLRVAMTDDAVLWFSQSNAQLTYRVERTVRNRRGAVALEYRCQCNDFEKEGRVDCKHIFAERITRGEVVVETADVRRIDTAKKADRRPARTRLAHDGRTVRRRSARRAGECLRAFRILPFP